MDFEDLIKQDKQAKQWLHDIESLRSPPPPRKLTGADIGTNVRELPVIREQKSPYNDYYNYEQPITNGESTTTTANNANDVDSDYDFLGKVKQFQLSDSHPYANKSRVDTAKKIAAQGRSAGLISGDVPNRGKSPSTSAGKKIISKQQVEQLRENVRRETRPINPYPNPDKVSPNPDRPSPNSSNFSPRPVVEKHNAYSNRDKHNLHVDTTANGLSGDLSSSAYSSYSSGEISKNNNNDTLYRVPEKRQFSASEIPIYKNTTKMNSVGREHYDQIRPSVNQNRENISSTPPMVNSSVKPTDVIINDRDLMAVFDDFDKDYLNLSNNSNRSISKSPNRIVHDREISVSSNPNGYSDNKYSNYSNPDDFRSASLTTSRPPMPPPPYRSNVSSVSPAANHARQVSSPMSSAISPSSRSSGANRNLARNLNRSQSMQENMQQNVDLQGRQQQHPPPITNNYERLTSGRDIIVDRIPRSATDYDGFSKTFPVNSYHAVNNYDVPKVTVARVQDAYVSNGYANSGSSYNGGNHVAIRQHENVSSAGHNNYNKYGSQDALEEQQRKYLQLEAQIEREMQSNAVDYGVCFHCGEKVTNVNEATQALGHLYHAKCFACCSCGRALKGKKFYEVRGQVYCEEDYMFSGFQKSAERCAVCGHLIMDMILQAVGKSFHPGCFRCVCCKESLDGVPFTMDDQERVYCINDYHRLFAPKCAKCSKPITPSVGRDETVRVVAMQKNYHVDCYVCEGCGLQLTDEPEKRCYPLGEHLLCHRCHIHWSRTGGTVHPITDL